MESATGGTYALTGGAPVVATDAAAKPFAAVARGILLEHRAGASVTLHVDSREADVGSEGYRLDVEPAGIAITARSPAGVFYGLQTLDQLLPERGAPPRMQTVRIVDSPAYRWRGMHVDVSRHFFSVSVLKRYVDALAHYKLNVLHLHLVDDQGWRMQIMRYPRLTSVGGCRRQSEVQGDATEFDGKPYCGHYTQAQLRQLVAYASARYVTIVPEIEMPGHSQAALAAYPWLGCGNGPYEVRTTWGISRQIYCPKESTFRFLENVLTEVMNVFPGRYIHIGGDEVPKDAWRNSPVVRSLMAKEHLATLDAVQGYFDRRIERFVEAHGRRIVGWDEILGGGVSRNATVMSWRGESGGIRAARAGNDAVMTPDGPLYFDAYQGDPDDEPQAIGNLSTPQEVYEYLPTPVVLGPVQRQHIVGVQGNLWTEYIDTPRYLFYMLLPRMISLSEIAWSDPMPRDWPAFEARMSGQYAWLRSHGYPYRMPNPEFTVEGGALTFNNVSSSVRTIVARTIGATVRVTIESPVPGSVVHCTIDGTDASAHSPACAQPIDVSLEKTARVDIRAVGVMPDGSVSTPSRLLIEREGAHSQASSSM